LGPAPVGPPVDRRQPGQWCWCYVYVSLIAIGRTGTRSWATRRR